MRKFRSHACILYEVLLFRTLLVDDLLHADDRSVQIPITQVFSFVTLLISFAEKVATNRTLRNENFYKPKLRAATRKDMAKHFQAEVEFYEFVKQRLYNQYQSVGGVK